MVEITLHHSGMNHTETNNLDLSAPYFLGAVDGVPNWERS